MPSAFARLILLPLSTLAACAFDPSGGGTAPGFPGAGADGPAPLPGGEILCYYGDDPTGPAASVEHTIETVQEVDALHVRLTLDPRFVDNTYGATAIGWSAEGGRKKKGHTFEDLVGSDRAELLFRADGAMALDLMFDYLTASAAASSGFATLGVAGGEGEVVAGDRAAVLATSTSMDRNLNERGYRDFTIDSPATDEAWSPSAEAPGWDFRVVYESWIALDAVGPSPAITLEYIHASPSKTGENTMVVEPGPCPDDWGCQDPDGCPGQGGAGADDGACQDPDGCPDDGGAGAGDCPGPDGCPDDGGAGPIG